MGDPTLNPATQAWVIQGLEEISGQLLGANRAAWRDCHARHL
jgi:hypothetical protein